jgi:hypothetical protein
MSNFYCFILLILVQVISLLTLVGDSQAFGNAQYCPGSYLGTSYYSHKSNHYDRYRRHVNICHHLYDYEPGSYSFSHLCFICKRWQEHCSNKLNHPTSILTRGRQNQNLHLHGWKSRRQLLDSAPNRVTSTRSGERFWGKYTKRKQTVKMLMI